MTSLSARSLSRAGVATLATLALLAPAIPSPAAPARTPASSAGAAARADAITLRVATYNIRFGQLGLDGVARDIRDLNADVVVLQEVDDRTRTGGADQAATLGRKLGMRVRYDPNTRTRFGLRGNAVLTKLAITGMQQYALPNPGDKEPRGLMKVKVRKAGIETAVWVTHLNPGAGKLAQARRVRELVNRAPRCATVLGGDMNTTPGTREYGAVRGRLNDLFARVGRGDGGTSKGGARIDYLFVDDVRGRSARVAPLRSSDHHPLVGQVRVTRAQGC